MAYATLSEVLVRMGHGDTADTELNARIEDALVAATTAIDNDTGRSFASTEATYEFPAPSGCDLWLLNPDLVSLTTLDEQGDVVPGSIKLDTGDDGTFATTLTAADYALFTYHRTPGWPYELVRLLSGSWPCGRRPYSVQITGTWGWAAVPAPINQACTLLALRIAQRPNAALFGVQSFGDGGAGYVRNEDPDYMHLIAPYVKHGIA